MELATVAVRRCDARAVDFPAALTNLFLCCLVHLNDTVPYHLPALLLERNRRARHPSSARSLSLSLVYTAPYPNTLQDSVLPAYYIQVTLGYL